VTFLVFNHVPPPLPRAVASTAPISCRAFVAVLMITSRGTFHMGSLPPVKWEVNVRRLLKNSPGADTGPAKSAVSREIAQAASPHAAFPGYFNRLSGRNQNRLPANVGSPHGHSVKIIEYNAIPTQFSGLKLYFIQCVIARILKNQPAK
jgi:hypothetical protein